MADQVYLMYAVNKVWYLKTGRKLKLCHCIRAKETKGAVQIIEVSLFSIPGKLSGRVLMLIERVIQKTEC